MGVLSSLFTGVSGLQAQGEALGVVGDNIANANTVGFKNSRAEFQDIIAKNLKGILGGNQIGRGVKIGAVNPILLQGNIDATENATDLAVSGDGYFVARGSDGQSFTRDGSLHFDKDGYLATNDGQRIQGFAADQDVGRRNELKERIVRLGQICQLVHNNLQQPHGKYSALEVHFRRMFSNIKYSVSDMMTQISNQDDLTEV